MSLCRKLATATALFAVAAAATVISACIQAGDAHDFDWDDDERPTWYDDLADDDDWGDS